MNQGRLAILAIVAALGVGGFLFMRARGLRNRNPANIEYNAANQWEGQTGSDGRYAVFAPHPEGAYVYGVRAAAKLLKNYFHNYGLNTVNKIIARFAPMHENPTDKYIDNVSALMQVGRDDPINLDYTPTLFWLLSGIFQQELGSRQARQVTPDQILKGIALAA